MNGSDVSLNVSASAAAAAAKQLLLIFYILLASYFWLNASNLVKQPTFYRYILFSCAQLYLHLFCFLNECILPGVICCSRFATCSEAKRGPNGNEISK